MFLLCAPSSIYFLFGLSGSIPTFIHAASFNRWLVEFRLGALSSRFIGASPSGIQKQTCSALPTGFHMFCNLFLVSSYESTCISFMSDCVLNVKKEKAATRNV